MIVVALGAASFAVVFMAAMVALVGFIGFREINRQAVTQAVTAARQELKSEEFRKSIQDEVSRVSIKAYFSRLQDQLSIGL